MTGKESDQDETTKAKEGLGLSDVTMDEVSGGVQADLICPGGPGEFGDPPPDELPPPKSRWF